MLQENDTDPTFFLKKRKNQLSDNPKKKKKKKKTHTHMAGLDVFHLSLLLPQRDEPRLLAELRRLVFPDLTVRSILLVRKPCKGQEGNSRLQWTTYELLLRAPAKTYRKASLRTIFSRALETNPSIHEWHKSMEVDEQEAREQDLKTKGTVLLSLR